MTEAAHPSSHRVVEAVVYGPLGLALTIADAAPGALDAVVERGRSEVERRTEGLSQWIRNTRSMGEAAIAFGLPMVRKKAKARAERMYQSTSFFRIKGNPATAPAKQPARPRPASVHTAPPAAANGNGNGRGHAPPSDDLAIPGYDALSASQVVERLVGLAHDELSAVRDYETAHRNRRTILGKIDQLTA